MPRELNRVPARLQESRDIMVRYDGRPVDLSRSGALDCGMVMLRQNPLIAEVKIREESRLSLSWGSSRDRNCTKGLIMYEFQRKESSKLSMSNEAALIGLLGQSHGS